jgi:hypothetical protein
VFAAPLFALLSVACLPAPCAQADKLDPREQAKMETREWVNDVVDRLTVRIEQFEYEMEEMAANLKKKAKPPPKLVQVRVTVSQGCCCPPFPTWTDTAATQ